MGRPTRFGLAVVLLLLAACGAYAVFWFVAASRLKDGIGLWADSLRAHHLDLSWRTVAVGGFPFAFRLELGDAALHDRRPGGGGEVLVPHLSAAASPWNFRFWRIAAPDGLSAATGAAAWPIAAKMSAPTATGSVLVGSDGGATLWFEADRPAGDAGMRIAAKQALLWLILPARKPQSHAEPAAGFALDLRELTLPTVPPPFRNPVDELAFGATLMGAVPDGPPRQAAAAWRDAGGTLELDRLSLHWGAVTVTGSGTVALDAELQPIAALSGAVEGYGELMAALVEAGRLKPGEAQLAGMALGFLAKSGPDGRPHIAVSFTIQDGRMFLGPLKLGPAPRIDWK